MSSIASAWHHPSDGSTYAPLTNDIVLELERRLGKKLPGSLLALLRSQNGGYLVRKYHPRVNGEVDWIPGIHPSLTEGFGSHDWSETLRYMDREGITEPAGLTDMVPFTGDGHYYVCLDYNRLYADEPSVSFVDVEVFVPAVRVADSFQEFLTQLTEEPPV